MRTRNAIALFIATAVVMMTIGCDLKKVIGSSRDYMYGSPAIMENATTGQLLAPGSYVCDTRSFLFRAAVTADKSPGERIVSVFYQIDGGNEYGVPFRGEKHQDYVRLGNPGAGSYSIRLRIETEIKRNAYESDLNTYYVYYTITWYVPPA